MSFRKDGLNQEYGACASKKHRTGLPQNSITDDMCDGVPFEE